MCGVRGWLWSYVREMPVKYLPAMASVAFDLKPYGIDPGVKEIQKLPLGKLPFGNFLYICICNHDKRQIITLNLSSKSVLSVK